MLCASKSLDGKEMELEEALRSVYGLGIGAVLICISNRLAYYEGEGKGMRMLCLREG